MSNESAKNQLLNQSVQRLKDYIKERLEISICAEDRKYLSFYDDAWIQEDSGGFLKLIDQKAIVLKVMDVKQLIVVKKNQCNVDLTALSEKIAERAIAVVKRKKGKRTLTGGEAAICLFFGFMNIDIARATFHSSLLPNPIDIRELHKEGVSELVALGATRVNESLLIRIRDAEEKCEAAQNSGNNFAVELEAMITDLRDEKNRTLRKVKDLRRKLRSKKKEREEEEKAKEDVDDLIQREEHEEVDDLKPFIRDVVTDHTRSFITSLVETYPGLRCLGDFTKVVLRADVSSDTNEKVAVISGGGNGHEIVHAGFVGEGMLTAAICGDIDSSPPVDSILAGIRAVTGPMGCVLIIKECRFDTLNFGVAVEQAKSEGYKVKMVIVSDEHALPPPRGIAERIGSDGIILVHKVAGAAADFGCSLEEVAARAKRASERVCATLFGTLASKVTSVGLQTDGEHDAVEVDFQQFDVVMSQVQNQILSSETNFRSRVVLMINGLGAIPVMKLVTVASEVVRRLRGKHELAVDRLYTGSFMTYLDLAGYSITVMLVDQATLISLDAPTKATFWSVGSDVSLGNLLPAKMPSPLPPLPLTNNPEPLSQSLQLSAQGRVLEVAIEAAANAVITLKEGLNEWGGKVNEDGYGTTMSQIASAIVKDMKHYPLNDGAKTVDEIGSSIARVSCSQRRTEKICIIFCKAAYNELKGESSHAPITALSWARALRAAISAVRMYGGASESYEPLLEALSPASEALDEGLGDGVDPVKAFVLSAEAGAKSTMKAPALDPKDDNEVVESVPAPSAMAAASWYKAAATTVRNQL